MRFSATTFVMESGGKLTFVGCYNAVMFTECGCPIVLPKFCIHFHIFSPRNAVLPVGIGAVLYTRRKGPDRGRADRSAELRGPEEPARQSAKGRRRPAFHRGCCKPGVCTARDIKARAHPHSRADQYRPRRTSSWFAERGIAIAGVIDSDQSEPIDFSVRCAG